MGIHQKTQIKKEATIFMKFFYCFDEIAIQTIPAYVRPRAACVY